MHCPIMSLFELLRPCINWSLGESCDLPARRVSYWTELSCCAPPGHQLIQIIGEDGRALRRALHAGTRDNNNTESESNPSVRFTV